MTADNSVTICGTLGRDPELRYTPAGQSIATFGVAVNRRWKDRNDEWQEATDWIDITVWGQLGENCAESLAKGNRVIVTGRFQQRQWETQEGDKRSKVEIVADDVAPSLKWATATVTRTERQDPGSSGRSGSGNQGEGGGGGQQARTTSAPPRPPQAQPPRYEDEEPFRVDVAEWLPGVWGEYPRRMF